MSVEDKTRLINNIKTSLSDILTVSDMDKTIEVITNELYRFDVSMLDLELNSKDDMLKAFINALAVEGRSPKTLKRYDYIIQRMLRSIKLPSNEISVYDIRSYLSKEKERGVSDRTLEGNRQIYSSYFGWLHREGMLKSNPIANIGAIKSKKKVKDTYSDVDIELMKSACKTIRDKALISFMLSTGCRISEIINLNRSDVDLINLECKVVGKGNKERVVYIDSITSMLLSKYLESRKDENEALFISSKLKERLHGSGVRAMLKEIQDISKVSHVHPHKFRRTFATNLIKRGMPIEEVAALLGHDKLDTTMQYVVLNKDDIKHAYARFS